MSNLDLNIIDMFHGDTKVLKIMKGDTRKWPLYDAKVEWLASDGLAYIDTGFKHNQDTRYVCKVNLPSTIGTWKYLFGSYGDASGQNKLFCPEIDGSGKIRTYYGGEPGTNQLHAFNIAASANSGTHTFDLNKNVHKVNSTSYTFPYANFQSRFNALIFGVTGYTGNIPSVTNIFKLYYFKIYDNGVLVRDFIPVRCDAIGYLYDNVSKTLYGNARDTGSFTYGNDV